MQQIYQWLFLLWLEQNGLARRFDKSQKTDRNLQDQQPEGLFKVIGLKFQLSIFTEAWFSFRAPELKPSITK